MVPIVLSLLCYILPSVGLVGILCAYPLAYGILRMYGGDIGDALEKLGLPAYVGYFTTVCLAILVLLAGSYLWFTQRKLFGAWAFSKIRLRFRQIYCCVMLGLAFLAPLANLLGLGITGLVILFEDIDTPMEANAKLALHISALLELGFTLAEFVIALLVARFFWRLFQSTRNHNLEINN